MFEVNQKKIKSQTHMNEEVNFNDMLGNENKSIAMNELRLSQIHNL